MLRTMHTATSINLRVVKAQSRPADPVTERRRKMPANLSQTQRIEWMLGEASALLMDATEYLDDVSAELTRTPNDKDQCRVEAVVTNVRANIRRLAQLTKYTVRK